jgi:DNA-binding NarL/FixJ family response regulator
LVLHRPSEELNQQLGLRLEAMLPRTRKFVASCYRSLGESGGASGSGLLQGFAGALDNGLAVGALAANVLPEGLEHVFSLRPIGISADMGDQMAVSLMQLAGKDLADATQRPNRFNSHSVFFGSDYTKAHGARDIVRQLSGLPVADTVTLDVPDGAGRIWMFSALLSKQETPNDEARRSWNGAAAHLAGVLRLIRQMQVAEPEAIFSRGGQVDHVGAYVVERYLPRLREAARCTFEHSGFWTEVVEGRWSLVQSRDTDGSIRVKAYRNCAGVADLRALSSAERDVLPGLALGQSNTTIAAGLGVSEATVSRHVDSTLMRLGCNRVAVPLFVRALNGAPVPLVPAVTFSLELRWPEDWSDAERDVASAALQGTAIADIAQQRARSEITVRAQLRSAARKAGAVDRLDLAVSLDAVIR